jgi:hypothetical protein
MFVQDYGGPVGFRLVTKKPKLLKWLIIQTTNAYEIGFSAAWGGLRDALWHKRNPEKIQMDLFYDYRTNVALYSKWQSFLKEHQPDTIIFWGQGDIFFTPAGGEAYLEVLPKAEMHRLDAGHFAVEDCLPYIAEHIHRFYDSTVAAKK